MLLRNLFENLTRTGKGKSAVLGWGRGMGHKGHMFLASSVITQAKQTNSDPYFVVSNTVGKDDPIEPQEKMAIYKKVFPQSGHIFHTATEDMPGLIHVLTKLNQMGYADVTVIVGADQVKAMQFVKNYNGKADKAGNIPYNFNSLNVISRQETSDPSAGEEGPRATPMRAVLMDPTKSEEEKFAVWRDAMNPELSDEEVMDLMHKAEQRMRAMVKPKKGVAEGSEDLVQIEYWQQETMESGRWVKTKPIPRATAEKIVNSFERGEIVNVEQGVAEGAPIVVMPSPERLKKPEPIKVRYQGDIVPPTQPPSTEKRGVKGRPGQRSMPDQGVAEGSLGNVLQWPEVVNKVNSAMKAMGWKGQRKDDGSFMFSTKGQIDDEFYIVIIENKGDGFFHYALGTVEEGDPYIGEQDTLPNTEASVSELMNSIREGYGLNETKEQEYGSEWDEKVKRLGQMAKQGERKTVWDPVKRVYKTVPVNAPKKDEPVKEKMMPASMFAGTPKNKLGPAAHLKGSMKRPARAGDLVGGDAQESRNISEDVETAMANAIARLIESQLK